MLSKVSMTACLGLLFREVIFPTVGVFGFVITLMMLAVFPVLGSERSGDVLPVLLAVPVIFAALMVWKKRHLLMKSLRSKTQEVDD